LAATFASVQVSRVSVDALTGALMDFVTHLKKIGEGNAIQLAAGLDLTFSQLCMLFIIDDSDHDLALHELAERLSLSMAATGRAVDVLVREGIVSRREDTHDRRVKRVVIEEPGARLLRRLSEAHREGLRAFARLLTAEERDNLFNALAPILARPELYTHEVEVAKETG
jgi:DNA-binding MarR family transcriptional regulator